MTLNLDQLLARKQHADRPKIVTLCGSTRFGEAYQNANLRETLAGHIVLSVGINTKSDEDLIKAGYQINKESLDLLHLHKIDLADEILVLNVNGYVGESTKREIEYARRLNKPVHYLERICCHRCVGALIRNEHGDVLLFQRGTPPDGYAGPAGHCDDDVPGDALIKEIREEVGLTVVHSRLIAYFHDSHACRRTYEDEPGHNWRFYECQVEGEICESAREVVAGSCMYYTKRSLRTIADRTERRLAGKMSDEEWQCAPGFDYPWYQLFQRLEML